MAVRLHVSESAVSVEAPNGARDSTRALVAVGIEAGRVGIIGVGEQEPELLERWRKPRPAVRGIAGRIVAAAEQGDASAKPLSIVRPGQEPYWDRIWQDSRAFADADVRRSRQILLLCPLAPETWSPHLVQGLLMYALWTSSVTGPRVWPAFRRPKIELSVDASLTGLCYEELVDQLWLLWGKARVSLPPDRPVAPPPATRLSRIARIAHIVFWLALIASIALSAGFDGSLSALAAAIVAVVALLVRRVTLARSRAERPRRDQRWMRAGSTSSSAPPGAAS